MKVGQYAPMSATQLLMLLFAAGCCGYLYALPLSSFANARFLGVSSPLSGEGTQSFIVGGSFLLLGMSVVALLTYHNSQNRRGLQREIWSIHEAMRTPQVAAAIIGADMPIWLSFPAVERSEWLQQVLTSLWPGLEKATSKALIAWMDSLLKYYCPPFLTKLASERMNLGRVPLSIRGVQGYSHTEHETVFDLHIDWFGDPDLRVVAAVGPLEVVARLSNFRLSGILRITLGPHVNVYPAFAALSLSFVGKPTCEFALTAAKLPLDVIPGLSGWLDSFVKDSLMWLMVHPKRWVYPLMDAGTYGEQYSAAEPTGSLHVTVTHCDGLLKKGFFSTTSPYATARLTSGDSVFRTATVTKERDPRFPISEPFKFLVYNVPNERLKFRVFHDAHETVLSKVGNVKGDECIGEAEVFVNSLLGAKRSWTVSLTLRTIHEGGGGKKDAVNGAGGQCGTLSYMTEFFPFESTVQGNVASTPSATTTNTSNGSILSQTQSGSGAPPVGTPRSLPFGQQNNTSFANAIAAGSSVPGVLLIHLQRANNLVKADMLGKSDPYVIFKVGASRAKSKMIPKTLDPVWDSKFEFEVTDALRDVLRVEVYDADLVTDRLIGRCSVPISEVLASNRRMTNTWPLTPQGTLTMELKLLTRRAAGT